MKEYDVIVRPHITEKSTEEAQLGKYTFEVNVKANKSEIKDAVEKLFNVKVISVHTLRYDGKKRVRNSASGASIGYTPAWKKAIVTIDTDPKDREYLTTGGKKVKTDKKYKNAIDEFGLVQ
ncbi:MAG: 50S ribosomal protein L23 [Clostridia bacterium]|jgi:large subunit ribosomal protein L23|nr:50S ribosomal protein L23 [Clostridia bacterium]